MGSNNRAWIMLKLKYFVIIITFMKQTINAYTYKFKVMESLCYPAQKHALWPNSFMTPCCLTELVPLACTLIISL